jgi:hypothetical protein
MPSVFESDRPSFPLPCPECHKPLKLVPIEYGYPTPEAFDAERRGELVIAGCTVGEDDPKWACAACQAPFMTALSSDPHFEVVDP